MITLKAKLIEFSEEFGGYVNYVFENLDSNEWDKKYILCCRYPHWDNPPIALGSVGFLTFTLIEAGSNYYDVRSGENRFYCYTHNRFDKFIPIQERIVDNKIVM